MRDGECSLPTHNYCTVVEVVDVEDGAVRRASPSPYTLGSCYELLYTLHAKGFTV